MPSERVQTIGFYVFLCFALVVAAFMFWPFAQLLALAGILAVLFKPLMERVNKHIHSQTWASILTVFLVLVIISVPVLIVGFVLYREIVAVYNNISNGSFSLDQATILHNLPESLQGVGKNFLGDFATRMSQIANSAVQGVTGIVSNVLIFFFHAFVVFFTLFYFLRDGDKLKKFIGDIFPLSQSHETKLADRLEQAVNGIVKGQFLVALSQGAFNTIGFFIFGVPQPFLWGAFMVLAALIPSFGTSLALIPAVLYLFLTGHIGAGIGMALWAGCAIALIDNFFAPRIIGSRTKLHPLLVLLAVLGGLQLFGILGFLLGPIIIAVVTALLDIYQTETTSGKNQKG